jgi:hypothetical protein
MKLPKAPRPLHPKLVAHGQKVKAAHAHLSATMPGYRTLGGPARCQAIQNHIRGTS